jgi:quercetin dioxygenase-like cupin family protein
MPDTFLRGLGGGAVQVHGEDGKFSSFVGDLCSLLLAQDYRVWIEDSKPTDGVQTMASIVVREHGMVNKAVDHIRDGIEASDVVEERVKELAKEMLRSIRERFHDAMISKGGVCLIFINDPCTPGGTEIERLIIDDPDLKKEISKMDLESVEITNRVTHTGPRNVKHWERHGHTKALIEYGAVVLIDSIAFTGNTFEVARAYLSKVSHRAKEKFTAAVLFMPSETKRKLKPQGKWWDVISPGSDYNGFDITFPWGWTTATQPVLQHTPADPFIPRDGFSFTPKPWGDQLTFCSGERASVSLLLFERGQRTSIHYHLLRNETFVVLDSRIRVCVWNRYLELRKHQSIRIPAGVPHSLIALDQPCRVLEIATGYYDAANDIVRLVDIYARKTRPDGSDDGLK